MNYTDAKQAVDPIGEEFLNILLKGYEKLYEAAGQPKKLVVFPITHYEIYTGRWFKESAHQAVEWFDLFLK